ncbi:glycosyltransferase [Affinirhizobium pseudoryzae]|uniref:glycosyltransferase n=1 Tax=Allorhizobium pseudoryzae TaxID=379684 RepID=UPI0013EDBBC0|nr:glycosyltransferase [Allorhizobium pseudoryzae]
MRILHVYKTYMPENSTGVPKVIYEISEPLSSLGVRSDVLVTGDRETQEPFKIGNHYVHLAKRDLHVASTSISISMFSKYRDLCKQSDVIHFHFPWPMMDVIDVAIQSKKPKVVTYHSDIVKQKRILPLYRPLMHKFLSGMDVIVATSENYLESSSTLQKFKKKVEVIPLGLGERPSLNQSKVEFWRQKVGSGFFLFIGANRYYKGLNFLVEAARNTQYPVVIAGFGFSGFVERERTPPNVKVVGAIDEDDKEALLELCGSFIFPSHLRSEAFGVSLLEAARASKAMISCEIGTGTSYVNRHGETGLVIPPANVEALSDAMTILHDNPALQNEYGDAARRRYETLFRSEMIALRYYDLYQRLCAD